MSRAPAPDIGLLRGMLLARRFEEALMQREDRGFQLLSSGQEAVAVGLCAALQTADQLLCSGRSIAPALARGLDPRHVMAELLGRTTGTNAGRAGRGHLSQPQQGFFGAHAVVGGNLTIAAGVALALQQQGAGSIAACLFGDGACGSGALHETMNIAAVWKLPLLLVCDNNGWAVSTPPQAALAPARLADLAAPFGMPAETVDGMDVRAVRDTVQRLAAHVRAGGGPAFVECVSQRFMPHSTSSRETRTPQQIAAARALCPIEALERALAAEGTCSGPALAQLREEVQAVVADALAFADASPMPRARDLVERA